MKGATMLMNSLYIGEFTIELAEGRSFVSALKNVPDRSLISIDLHTGVIKVQQGEVLDVGNKIQVRLGNAEEIPDDEQAVFTIHKDHISAIVDRNDQIISML